MNGGPLTQLTRKISFALSKSDAQDLQAHLDKYGNPIADTGVQNVRSCHPGQRVEVIGTVKIVAIRPRDMSPAVEIVLADPTGAINVVWLGRRKIPGIVAGRTMKVCGRLTGSTEKPTMFNPQYELRPSQR
jgi:RecG-like helicase